MFGWLKPKESEAARGARCGCEFVASNPGKEEILKCWSSACIDQAFASDDGEFAKAWKREVRPLWERAHA